MKQILISALLLCALVACKPAHPPIGGPNDFHSTNGNAGNMNEDVNTPNTAQKDDSGKEGDLSSLSGRALNPVFFDYDSSELRPDQIAVLRSDATSIRSGSSMIIIEGHCDERGTEEYNLALGSRRADITKSYLVSQGISADRLSTISYGENKPFAKGHNESSWQKNRRAQLVTQ